MEERPRTDPDESLTILGAGVAGLCAATELVGRGWPVRLLDPAGPPGEHGCSWWAGGMLAPWCEGETAEEPVVRLGEEAAGWWERHVDCVTREGSLVVALGRDQREIDRFARRTRAHETVGAERISELEPDLAGRFPRGLLFPGEAHLDPRAALAQLVEVLAARGVAIERQHGEPGAGWTLDCRGLAARDRLPDLRGVKGEMVVLRCPEVRLHRTVRLLHPRIPLYIVPRGEGVYMLGATSIESGERHRATVRSVLELLSAAFALHPSFGEGELLEIGVDARPAFPDHLPAVRREGRTLFLNGLYRHGFLLAPALARQAAELLETEHAASIDRP